MGIDYAAIAPPLILAVAALGVLFADVFRPARRRSLLGRISLLGVLGALACVAALAVSGGTRRTFCLPGGAGGSYVVDDFTLVFQVVVLAAAGVVLLLAAGGVRGTALPAGGFHFLGFCSLARALTLVAHPV